MSAPMKIEEAWLEAIRAVDWQYGARSPRAIYTAYLSAVAPLIWAKALEEAAMVANEHRGWIEDGEIAAGIRALAAPKGETR